MSDDINLTNQPSSEAETVQTQPSTELGATAIPTQPSTELGAPGPSPLGTWERSTLVQPLSPSPEALPEAVTVPVQVAITAPAPEPEPEEPAENFADLLKAFDSENTHRDQLKQLEGMVVSVSADQVFLDVGYKVEGVLPRSAFPNNADEVKPGDKMSVSITGRDEGGYYTLSRHRVRRVTDWAALESAFADKVAIAGTVTAIVKGGLTVDVGVRAFMPASRSRPRSFVISV